jgi:hypothetical protein
LARRIDCDDRDSFAARAKAPDERIQQRRLACAGRPRDADSCRARKCDLAFEAVEQFVGFGPARGAPIVGEVERFGDGIPVAVQYAGGEIRLQRYSPRRRPRSRT